MESEKTQFMQCLLFVSHKATREDVGQKKIKGFVLLPSSVSETDAEITQLFTRNSIQILDSNECPLLQAAVKLHNVELLELIVKRCGQKNVFASKSCPFFPVAVEAGNEELVTSIFGKDTVVFQKSDDSFDIQKAIDDKNVGIVERLFSISADIRYRNPRGETLLHLAAVRDDLMLIELLAKYGADLNAKGKDWSTPLHVAILENKQNATNLLLEKGAAVNMRRKDGSTGVFLAVRFWRLEILKLLSKHNADVNIGKYNGLMPLHLAANNNDVKIADCLLEHGAFINAAVTYHHAAGVTPLCLAVEQEDATTVELLLRKGADVNIPCYGNETILKLAVDREYVDIVECILRYNPDLESKVNKKTFSQCVCRKGKKFEKISQLMMQYGFTFDAESENLTELLYNAICKNLITIVEKLLKSGVNVNQVYHYYDDSLEEFSRTVPLLTAAQNKRNDIVKLLVDHGADINVVLELYQDLSPFDAAEYNWEAVKIMLAGHSSHQTEDDSDCMCWFLACHAIENDSPEILDKVVCGSTSPENRTFQSLVPMNLAVKQGSLEVLDKLVKLGASVNCRDEAGRTPLHCVTDKHCVEAVKFLIERNADIEARCFDGQTPIFKAVKDGHRGVVKELMKYCARIDVTDSFNRSPLHYAIAEGQWGIFIAVLDHYFADLHLIFQETNIFQFLRVSYLTNLRSDDDPYIFKHYEENKDRFDHASRTLMNIMVKMKTAYLDSQTVTIFVEQNLEALVPGEFFFSNYSSWHRTKLNLIHTQAYLEMDIARMKSQMVCTLSVSFYDILTKDVHQLACYARNSSIVQTLNSKIYEGEFLRYQSVLSYQILKGTFRRELLDQSAKVCHLLVGQFKTLPFDIKEDVLSYLSNRELEVLVFACKCLSRADMLAP